MILRRLRLRAGIYVSALLLLVGLALAARATEPITKSQAEAMIDSRLAAAGVLVFGAFWVLLLTFTGRQERALTASILRLEAAVASFTKALADHDASPLAHTAASEHNHDPMNAQAGRIEEKLDALILEHRVIRGTEDEVCHAIRSLANQKRSPADSPNPKRKTDSGDDYTPLRGKQ